MPTSRDKARKISRPAWLLAPPPDVASAAVLFWSGGKDSFLALRKLLADESEPEIILLTTFDASERRVAHQDVDIASIVRQAEHRAAVTRRSARPRVGRGLRGFHRGAGLAAIRRHVAIERLCFGDLHLEHIRGWREEALSGLGADLHFPLWHADYEDLSADLRASGVPCDVSATTVDAVAVGERFGEFETPRRPRRLRRARGIPHASPVSGRCRAEPRSVCKRDSSRLLRASRSDPPGQYSSRNGFSPRTGAGESAAGHDGVALEATRLFGRVW